MSTDLATHSWSFKFYVIRNYQKLFLFRLMSDDDVVVNIQNAPTLLFGVTLM